MVSFSRTEASPLTIIPLLIRPPQTSLDPSLNRTDSIPIVKSSELAMVISRLDKPPHSKIHYAVGVGAAANPKVRSRQQLVVAHQ